MFLNIKTAAGVSFVLLFLALSWQFLKSDTSLSTKNTDRIVIFSPNQILNSDKVNFWENKSYEFNMDRKKDVSTSDSPKIVSTDKKQRASQVNIPHIVESKKDLPDSVDNKIDKKGVEWLLDILTESNQIETQANYYNTGNFTYNFDQKIDKYINQLNKEDKEAPEETIDKSYVNYLALIIAKYQVPHATVETIKKQQTWVNNFASAGKESFLKEGEDYLKIYDELSILKLPADLAGINTQFATAYKEAGEKMLGITKAKDRQSLLNALLEYNKASEKVGRAYLFLVDFIELKDLHFRQDEPGYMFIFNWRGKFNSQ